MGLFTNYNRIMYPLTDENGVQKIYNLVDITTRVRAILSEKELLDLTDKYTIGDNETPEFISFKLYGTNDYYWTILFINELYDYINDWHMTDNQLQKYCEEKYQDANANKHIINEYGIVVMNADPDLLDFQERFTNVKRNETLQTVTNYDWEHVQNESRRNIRVIKPSKIVNFVSLFNEAFK